MTKWLTSFFLLFAITGGISAGMPFHSEKKEMMDCCPKAMNADGSPATSMARLCCALNCTDPAPTSSSFSSNFTPSAAIVENSISVRIVKSRSVRLPSQTYERPAIARSSQPKYIQFHSFLI